MATTEDPFKEFPNVSKLAEALGKYTVPEHPLERMANWYSKPNIPIKEIHIGHRTYEVINGFTKRKRK